MIDDPNNIQIITCTLWKNKIFFGFSDRSSRNRKSHKIWRYLAAILRILKPVGVQHPHTSNRVNVITIWQKISIAHLSFTELFFFWFDHFLSQVKRKWTVPPVDLLQGTRLTTNNITLSPALPASFMSKHLIYCQLHIKVCPENQRHNWVINLGGTKQFCSLWSKLGLTGGIFIKDHTP